MAECSATLDPVLRLVAFKSSRPSGRFLNVASGLRVPVIGLWSCWGTLQTTAPEMNGVALYMAVIYMPTTCMLHGLVLVNTAQPCQCGMLAGTQAQTTLKEDTKSGIVCV